MILKLTASVRRMDVCQPVLSISTEWGPWIGAQKGLRIPGDVAHDSEMNSPTIPN